MLGHWRLRRRSRGRDRTEHLHLHHRLDLCEGALNEAISRIDDRELINSFFQGCRHGLEKDVYMSLPCVVGREGVQTLLRHQYTPEEQELMEASCRAIYETQKSILQTLE